MLKELMAKMERADICHDFFVSLILGEKPKSFLKKKNKNIWEETKKITISLFMKILKKELLKVS